MTNSPPSRSREVSNPNMVSLRVVLPTYLLLPGIRWHVIVGEKSYLPGEAILARKGEVVIVLKAEVYLSELSGQLSVKFRVRLQARSSIISVLCA